MFVELGWNTVLHSSAVAGAGLGVFCGHIDHWHDVEGKLLPPKLTFCIADIGRGIPSTLRTAYHSEKNPAAKYHLIEGFSENTGIVRYALDPTSTSRPDVPSYLDREGFRGLGFVSRALQGVGGMQIRSDGGFVKLTGHPEGTQATLSDTFREARILGTQVIGHLLMKAHSDHTTVPAPKRRVLEPISVHIVCDPDGECPALATNEAASSFASKVQAFADTLIFDLGYADDSARSLEYLCKNVLPIFPKKWCVFWGIRTSWSVLAGLDNWLVSKRGDDYLPPLFVRAHQDARILGAAKHQGVSSKRKKSVQHQWLHMLLKDSSNKEGDTVGKPVALTTTEFVRLTNEINSAYLEEGFSRVSLLKEKNNNASSGFFTGNIHLLKGGAPAARYFSITNNVTGSRDANLRRWVEGFSAAVVRHLEKTVVEDAELILLGFTATMREVLTQVFIRLGRQCRAYALLTYDIPSKEEIESKVRPGDKVLLLTDVISTGTLVESVYSLIRRVNASVIGIVSLVDIRRASDSAESAIEINRNQVPLITCGQVRKPVNLQSELADTEYWVDPVSLVPSRDKSWGWDEKVDAKIEKTLDLVRDANAAVCGHIIDGTRHTSVYVNLHKLLETQDIVVAEQITTVCQQRLKERGWNDFSPSIVLYPSGIARIENVGRQLLENNSSDSTNVYQTAVRAYVERLLRIWPNLEPLEVLRAFDPGGASRCAKTVDVPKTVETPLRDVIVADDGMWRGTTVSALTQIALRLGAKRILITPLLARLSPTEAEHLETRHSVRSPDSADVVEVCHAFPMLLPIPYYGVQECPYEITINRLEDRRSRLKSIARITTDLIRGLKGHTPAECPSKSALYCETWVRIRTYVELASEHQGVLEKLTRLIENAVNSEVLLAIFEVFSEEWQLLGRARLRQTVRATLKNCARRVAVSTDTIIEVRTAAITVLRTLFREDFVELLDKIAGYIIEHPAALGRVVMQVATLPDEWRARNECVHFLEAISDRVPMKLDANLQSLKHQEMEAHFGLVTDCKNLSLELHMASSSVSRTQRDSANELLHFLTNDPALRHNTRPFVETLANSAESIRELKIPTFISFDRQWREEHEPRLATEVVPRLKAVSRLLLRVGTQGHRIVNTELSFLEKECESLRTDIVSLTTGLAWLKKDPTSKLIQHTVVSAASRLMTNILSEESTSLRLLNLMRYTTVHQALNNFSNEITARFEAIGSTVKVSTEGLASIPASSTLFISSDIVSACFGNVLDNLFKYAFPHSTTTARVELQVEEHRDEESKPMLSLHVKNNGEAITSARTMGSGGQRAASDLKIFGGQYFTPQGTEEQPWRVIHRMEFPLW